MSTVVHRVQFQKGDEATAMCGAALRRPKDTKEVLPWAGFLDHVTCPHCLARYSMLSDIEWEE